MKLTQGPHKYLFSAAIVFILFGTYGLYGMFLSGRLDHVPFVQNIAAKDGEDNNDEGDDSNDDNGDDNKDSDKQKETEKHKREAAKEREKRSREAAKKQWEQSRHANESEGSNVGDNNENEVETESDVEDSQDNSGKDQEEAMFKNRTKTLEHINEKLGEAEKKILEKQAEGVDVTAALAALKLAKEKATGVDALFVSNDIEKIKDLTKETEELAHAARGKVLHAAEKAVKDVAKIDKRITKTKTKIAQLKNAGGDTSAYESRMSGIEAEWATVKAALATGGDGATQALASLDTIERKVKALKKAVEQALESMGVSDDNEFESEHASEIADASHEIDDLADIEEEDNHDMTKLKQLNEAHRKNAIRAAVLMAKFQDRSPGLKQLIGDDRQSLTDLQQVVTENNTQIQAMEGVAANVPDKDVATLISEKLKDLKEQNAQLQSFITEKPLTTGLFGWLFNWF